jgi:hypothetical protein
MQLIVKMFVLQIGNVIVTVVPPSAARNSLSDSSITPAGSCGSTALSDSLKLQRYSSSFQARIMSGFVISRFSFVVMVDRVMENDQPLPPGRA